MTPAETWWFLGVSMFLIVYIIFIVYPLWVFTRRDRQMEAERQARRRLELDRIIGEPRRW